MKKINLYLGIFFISLSVLIFEMVLIRMFSAIVTANLAFLGISIALFGLSSGGIIVYLIPDQFKNKKSLNLGLIIILYAVYLVFFIIILMLYPLRQINFFSMASIFIVSSVPFLIVNICLSLIFKINSQTINQLYFFDLLGAGLGVVSSVILMNYFPAINVILISSLLGLVAALFFNADQKKYFIAIFIIFIVITSLFAVNSQTGVFRINILFNKIGLDKKIIFDKWNSFSHISVAEEFDEQLLIDKGQEKSPNRLGVRIDGDAYTPIYRFNGDWKSIEFLKSHLSSLVFQATQPGQVLIIGPGGGRDVLMALMFDHKVTGVEINPIIVNDIMKKKFKEFSGNLYFNPRVNIKVAEGRSFIHNDTNQYDIIDMPLVDTWAATAAGNLALVEGYLYTVEAFEDYLKHLTQRGILSISRWEKEGIRLLPIYFTAAKKLGIKNPNECIVVVKSNNKLPDQIVLYNYLFKTAAFTSDELQNIQKFVNTNNADIVYAAPLNSYANDHNAFIASHDKDDFIKMFPINIRPVYDNNPFFFFIIPINKIFNTYYDTLDGGLGITFIIVLIFSLLCIILPFFKKSEAERINRDYINSLAYLGYFSALGAAFMFIEIVLIQKFILYLEKPIYSYSVILTSMLICAAIGSSISNKFNAHKKIFFSKISFGIFILVILCIILIKPITNLTISLPILYRIVMSIIMVSPVSILMGMMLPLGIKRLSLANKTGLIPWCWAVNGAMSIFSTVLSIILAISYGFDTVLLIGGIIYIVAFFCILLSDTNKKTNF